MSAFKFLTKHSTDMVNESDPSGTPRVDIYMKSGRLHPVRWIGFCRQEEIASKVGSLNWNYAKMAAISVSKQQGAMSDRWRILLPSEFVLSFMMPYNTYEPGVYTLVDERGWPIVKSHRAKP